MSVIRFNQSVATAGKTSFIYDYEVLNKNDIEVFLTPAGQPSSDASDRLIVDDDYVVEGVGVNAGGTIVLFVPAEDGDRLTLIGNRKAEPPAEFQPGQLSAQELNAAFAGLTVLIQNIETKICRQMVAYQATNVFDDLSNNQTLLPVLKENFSWAGTLNNGIIQVELPDSVDAGILRAQLADQQINQDGSRIVGYYNPTFDPNSTTVHDALARLDAKVKELEEPGQTVKIEGNILLGGDFSNNPFQSGSVTLPLVDTLEYVADGWYVDQKGTLQVQGSKNPSIVPLVSEGTDILLTASMELEINVNQPVLTANDQCVFGQIVEGNIFRPLAQTDDMRLSFWALCVLPGIYSVSMSNFAADRSIVKEYEILNSNVWQFFTIDFPKSPADGTWNYANDIGLRVSFALTAGTNHQTSTLDTWEAGSFIASTNQVNFLSQAATSKFHLADVILSKKGTFRVPRRTEEEVLAFSQRYFEKSYNQGVDPGTFTNVGNMRWQGPSIAGDTAMAGLNRVFATVKRDTPNVTWYGVIAPGGPQTATEQNTTTLTVVSDQLVGQSSTGQPDITGGGGPGGGITGSAVIDAHWTADARLK